jgi:hypothetical protein
MSRILIVAFRPHSHQRETVLKLLFAQHLRVMELGLINQRPPWVMEGSNGEIAYIAAFEGPDQIDRCWQDEAFQDLDSKLLEVADMVPIQSLQEASGAFLDMEELDVAAIAAMYFAENAPAAE